MRELAAQRPRHLADREAQSREHSPSLRARRELALHRRHQDPYLARHDRLWAVQQGERIDRIHIGARVSRVDETCLCAVHFKRKSVRQDFSLQSFEFSSEVSCVGHYWNLVRQRKSDTPKQFIARGIGDPVGVERHFSATEVQPPRHVELTCV